MKQKTKQAASKRFNFTSKGKAKRRTIGQAHFNARANGDDTRRKHHDRLVKSADKVRLHEVLPYSA
jgi:ribosomal protein L35